MTERSKVRAWRARVLQKGTVGSNPTLSATPLPAARGRFDPVAARRRDQGIDPVIEAYKRDVDRTLLEENLKRTPEERIRRLAALARQAEALRGAAREAKRPR